MIEIKNISKTFKNNKVLDGIDLTINQGDVVAIIGPSGTGKSTFLRCVDRLENRETGTITIDGETQDPCTYSWQRSDRASEKDRHGFSEFQSFFKEDSTSECNGGADRGKEDEKRGSRKDCERAA